MIDRLQIFDYYFLEGSNHKLNTTDYFCLFKNILSTYDSVDPEILIDILKNIALYKKGMYEK